MYIMIDVVKDYDKFRKELRDYNPHALCNRIQTGNSYKSDKCIIDKLEKYLLNKGRKDLDSWFLMSSPNEMEGLLFRALETGLMPDESPKGSPVKYWMNKAYNAFEKWK